MQKLDNAFQKAELYLAIAEGILTKWLEAETLFREIRQQGISRSVEVEDCIGCVKKTQVFIAKRKMRMDETQQELEQRLSAIRKNFNDRLTRRINMTREAIIFIEESKGHLCGGCAERRLELLRHKLEELEKRQQTL